MKRAWSGGLAPLLLFAAAGLASPAAAQSLTTRTLTRTVDTVVIKGAVLGPKILGANKYRVRVYACRSGFMVPISYQIDERNAEGTYCWDRGPIDRRIEDEDHGLVDSNDELVVLAQQAGDRARPESLAQVPGYTAVQEVQLTDPLTQGKAWIYVFRFDGMPLPGRIATHYADIRVVRHPDDASTYYWSGEHFKFNNDLSRNNAVRATFAQFARPGTRDFAGEPNFLDCTMVRAVVSFMWITVVRQSADLKVKIGGYIDGPLRVVAENRMKVYLALGIWVRAPSSYVILWRDKVSMPTNASCPVNLDTSDESSYMLCMDLRKETKGWKFYNSNNPTPVAIDGRWSRAEGDLDMSYPDWNCVYGPQGAVISKFVIPEFLRKKKGTRLYYIDNEYYKDKTPEDGTEFQPGAFGRNGYLVDMRGMKEGVYPGDYVVWYVAAPFKPGDQVPYINEYEHPLVARATPMAAVPDRK